MEIVAFGYFSFFVFRFLLFFFLFLLFGFNFFEYQHKNERAGWGKKRGCPNNPARSLSARKRTRTLSSDSIENVRALQTAGSPGRASLDVARLCFSRRGLLLRVSCTFASYARKNR